jgi:hypothetical protein
MRAQRSGGGGAVGREGNRPSERGVGLSDWNRDFVDSNLVVWAGCVWLSGTSLAIVRYNIYIYIYMKRLAQVHSKLYHIKKR